MNIKPPLHIIMHVPKTGGASIADGMKKLLDLTECFVATGLINYSTIQKQKAYQTMM
jgi:hypothetical protein